MKTKKEEKMEMEDGNQRCWETEGQASGGQILPGAEWTGLNDPVKHLPKSLFDIKGQGDTCMIT